MQQRIALVKAFFQFSKGIEVVFDDTVEVSLDCSDCHRKRRTVIFYAGKEKGKCTPTGHPFRGKLISKHSYLEANRYFVEYKILYEYEPFVDAKYPNEKIYYGESKGIPTWGRISFALKCPKCKSVSKESSQNNLVRPYSCTCACGFELYEEQTEIPILEWEGVNSSL